MADQNNIDRSSEQIANLVDKAKADLLTDLYNIKRTMTLGEFVEIVSTMDIEGTLKKNVLSSICFFSFKEFYSFF